MQKLVLFLFATLLVMNTGVAMTLEVEGNLLFASGPVGDDWLKFKEALATPRIDTVVFVNSQGGDLWTGLMVGKFIADSNLKTVTAGYCVSACSIMFMGGKSGDSQTHFRQARLILVFMVRITVRPDKSTRRCNRKYSRSIREVWVSDSTHC